MGGGRMEVTNGQDWIIKYNGKNHRNQQCSQHCMISLVHKPSTPPVFDHLQYVKLEREGLGNLITWSTAQLTADSRYNSLFTFLSTATEKLENQNNFQRRGKSYL